jgi:hypothetical protein
LEVFGPDADRLAFLVDGRDQADDADHLRWHERFAPASGMPDGSGMRSRDPRCCRPFSRRSCSFQPLQNCLVGQRRVAVDLQARHVDPEASGVIRWVNRHSG